METIKCAYCDCTVRMQDVDAEDGVCPECGAPVAGSVLFDEEHSEAGVGPAIHGVDMDEDGLDADGRTLGFNGDSEEID